MSKPVDNPTVGMPVYAVGQPRQAGVIVALPIAPHHLWGPLAEVAWFDGTTSTAPILHLQDFDALIDETTRKLTTHHKTRATLEARYPGVIRPKV